MLNSENGLIISDTKNSAISTSSRVWAEKLGAKIIYALDFSSLSKLVRAIDGNYSWVLFSWRGSLELILNDKFLTARLNRVSLNTLIYFSVPDHIDLSLDVKISSNPIYEYSDGFTVVSRRLQNLYNSLLGNSYTPQLLPDFPNIRLLDEVREMKLPKKTNSVIWVGNSRWGESLGLRDHKGFESLLKNIIKISIAKSLALKFRVIDRGVAYVPHRDTLIAIAESEFLLQTSAAEGTGLPVLEAIALGTFPITTDVGINREVFGARWQEFEASTPESFIANIESSIESINPSDLEDLYLRYLNQISQILHSFDFPQKDSVARMLTYREKYLAELGVDFGNRLRWPVRFLLNKLRTFSQELKTRKL